MKAIASLYTKISSYNLQFELLVFLIDCIYEILSSYIPIWSMGNYSAVLIKYFWKFNDFLMKSSCKKFVLTYNLDQFSISLEKCTHLFPSK